LDKKVQNASAIAPYGTAYGLAKNGSVLVAIDKSTALAFALGGLKRLGVYFVVINQASVYIELAPVLFI